MKTQKMLAACLAMGIAAVPVVAFTFAGESGAAGPGSELGLVALIPSDQYKMDYSEAENVEIGEWYTENGIEFSWHEEEGMSRTVVPDDWNDEAQAAMAEYNENLVFEDFPAGDREAVNAQVDEIIAALADVGIEAEGPLDEEGFKVLSVDINPTDEDAVALWSQANAIIASLDE